MIIEIFICRLKAKYYFSTFADDVDTQIGTPESKDMVCWVRVTSSVIRAGVILQIPTIILSKHESCGLFVRSMHTTQKRKLE